MLNNPSMSATHILSGPKFKRPVESTTLGQFFFSNAQKYGDRVCQIDGNKNESETFASVKMRSTRLAMAMQRMGISADDVVTICSPNTLNNTIPILSAFYLGAKVANLEGSLSVAHTKHLLGLVSPKMIFVDEAKVELIEQSLEGSDLSPDIIVFGQSQKYCVFSDLVLPQDNEEEFTPVQGNPDDVGVIFFSSGTTGLPKAICHSHNSFLWIVQQVDEIGHDGSSLHLSSFYWITAMLMLTTCFKTGNYRVFCTHPTAEEVFRIIETYKVEYFFTAPVLTYMLTGHKNAKNYNTSSVKLLKCAGTPMEPSQIKRLGELFPNSFISLTYALTEGGLVSSFNYRTDRELAGTKLPLGSCGKVAPEIQLKISDLDTRGTLGPRHNGEICIKSQGIMKGYYRAESSQVFDGAHFLKTGDLGHYDEDGCLFIIGRVKEMFKYQSWHIVPSLIEAIVSELPAVKEVVVVGVPCGEDGEVPAAAVVLNEDCSLTKQEIDEFLDGRLSDREKLRGGVIFLDQLSKTTSGKMQRPEIRNAVLKSLQKQNTQ